MQKIGFLGLGKMGAVMAPRFIEAGFPLTVWNRSAEKAEALGNAGATVAETPAAVAESADIVISMLGDDAAAEQVFLGDTGLLSVDVDDKLFIEMSTLRPPTARMLAARCSEKGAGFIDAPVSGTVAPAKDGKLMALAVSSPQRATALPDVSTTLESGYPDSDYTFWMGVFMPAKTPPEIVAKFHSELRKALEAPAVKAKLATLGVEAMPLSSAEFDAQVKKEFVTYTSFAKAAGLTPAN